MGTYTTNYNLFMPTVGETGWGELVNGNFSTLDSTIKSLSNRITAVENEVNGALSCTSVTTSGTITSTGKITGNGGLSTEALTATTGTFSGAVTANKLDQSAVHTVSCGTPATARGSSSLQANVLFFVLPTTFTTYTGSIKIYNVSTTDSFSLFVRTGEYNLLSTVSATISTTTTISFTNATSVYIWVNGIEAWRWLRIGTVTLS